MESPAIRLLWMKVERRIPGVQLGGIYADKPGYHGRRSDNLASNYSVQLTVDRQGPDLSSAIDLTMSTSQMILRTGYLDRAARDPLDDRTSYIREFIGTLDGSEVHCRIASGPGTAFQLDPGRDDSHLWHIHISFYRLYCNDARAMDAILSVLSGETYEQWIGGSIVAVEDTVNDIHRLLHDGTRAPGQANTSGGGVPIAWIVRKHWEHENKLNTILVNLQTLSGQDFVNEEQIVSGVLNGLGDTPVDDIANALRATLDPTKLQALKEAL